MPDPYATCNLEQLYKEEWNKDPVSRCEALIETYPCSLSAMTEAKGSSTKN